MPYSWKQSRSDWATQLGKLKSLSNVSELKMFLLILGGMD